MNHCIHNSFLRCAWNYRFDLSNFHLIVMNVFVWVCYILFNTEKNIFRFRTKNRRKYTVWKTPKNVTRCIGSFPSSQLSSRKLSSFVCFIPCPTHLPLLFFILCKTFTMAKLGRYKTFQIWICDHDIPLYALD